MPPPVPQDAPSRPPAAAPASDDDPRPLRADAERNRRLIIDAAAGVFAERGLLAGFDEIARAAGVGVGTVYRRFPDRDDLIDALFAERIEAMVELAAEAAELEDDPWAALARFLERSVAAQAGDRGLAEALGDGLRGRRRLEAARGRMVPAVEALLVRARLAGVVRPDVEVLDLATIGNMLVLVANDSNPELWRRYLPIVLDGLRRRPDSAPLTLPPPTEADLAHIAQRR